MSCPQASRSILGPLCKVVGIYAQVFLKLLEGKDEQTHRRVAWRACSYATLLLFFFLVFGTLLLDIFEVPLSMVRIVGGIILMRIGFSLFMPSGTASSIISNATSSGDGNVAFVPLAMPLMFGPGAIATEVDHSAEFDNHRLSAEIRRRFRCGSNCDIAVVQKSREFAPPDNILGLCDYALRIPSFVSAQICHNYVITRL